MLRKKKGKKYQQEIIMNGYRSWPLGGDSLDRYWPPFSLPEL
jgi:hypothetical protein